MGRTKRNAALLLPVVRSPRTVWRFLRDPDTPRAPKLGLVAALLYVLLPADLIPDVAPVIGWLDDIGVVALALAWMARQVHKSEKAAPSAEQRMSG